MLHLSAFATRWGKTTAFGLKPFPKGVSGNPGGKKKLTSEDRDALEMLRQGAPAAAKLMLDTVAGKRSSVARVQAAKDVLDRVYGRAIQQQDVRLNDQRSFVVAPKTMSRAEWDSVLAAKRGELPKPAPKIGGNKLPKANRSPLPVADTLRTQNGKAKIN